MHGRDRCASGTTSRAESRSHLLLRYRCTVHTRSPVTAGWRCSGRSSGRTATFGVAVAGTCGIPARVPRSGPSLHTVDTTDQRLCRQTRRQVNKACDTVVGGSQEGRESRSYRGRGGCRRMRPLLCEWPRTRCQWRVVGWMCASCRRFRSRPHEFTHYDPAPSRAEDDTRTSSPSRSGRTDQTRATRSWATP